MPYLGAALHDSANITESVELGSQNLTTTGTITAGAMVIPRPYGSFSSSQTQTIANVSNAQAITFDTDEVKNQITHSTSVNNTRIYVDVAGVYRICFSVIAICTANAKLFNIWLNVDNSPIARTNTIQNLSTQNIERIITVEFMYTFTANQYFEIMMWSNDLGTSIKATGTQSTPTRPACPSIILDINKVSS